MVMFLNSRLNYHFTPTPTTIFHLYLFTFLSISHFPINYYAFNITEILSHYPDLSDFTALLTTTGVSAAVDHFSSVTILAVPNTYLRSSPITLLSSSLSPNTLSDVIRYHVLLQYLTWSDLRRIQQPGSLITTLLQTTGRVPDNLGSLNATFNATNGVVSFHPPNNNTVSTTVISLLKTVPYNLSILTVDSLLFPYDFDLTASETRPQSPQPPKTNITAALINGHDFNVATSMLIASGVVSEFEKDEEGAGITLFIPTDLAFSNLPSAVNLQELPADEKSLVLKFHVLHSYYTLGSLESIVNPAQPTLATEDNGAGSFTLNISRVNGSVSINTGLVQAEITQTAFDEKPVAIFGVSNVFLPEEVFGKGSKVSLGGRPIVAAQPPDIGPGPVSEPDGPTRLVSPSVSKGIGVADAVVILSCIGGGLIFYGLMV
ncbi:hypothetical protein RND81_04G165300 [Saponaria officinalis]|uniref:FAS1 domain-containing protein n=1 Tax=Saponaria officinalis TaxID=3572 RepID=A0AAW1LFA0_SAPOF